MAILRLLDQWNNLIGDLTIPENQQVGINVRTTTDEAVTFLRNSGNLDNVDYLIIVPVYPDGD